MMSRVKQGLSPTEETVVDSATGTVMSSAGTGGSGSGDNGSKNSGFSSSLSGMKIAVKNGSGIQGCANEAASKLTPQGAVCETGNADDYNYKNTIVVYNSTDSNQAQKIADLLGVGTVKKNDGTYSFTGGLFGSGWLGLGIGSSGSLGMHPPVALWVWGFGQEPSSALGASLRKLGPAAPRRYGVFRARNARLIRIARFSFFGGQTFDRR